MTRSPIRRLASLLACTFLLTASTCNTGGTVIQFAETINFLDHIQPSTAAMTGRRISGFLLGDFDSERDLLQRHQFGPVSFALSAAGPETPPCNDGTPLLVDTGDPWVRILSLIGDTGGDDVSEDADCHCDTHIQFMEFGPLELRFADGGVLRLPASRMDGRRLLCPNIAAGHLLRGDREFGGGVAYNVRATLRVADDGSGLWADIQYTVSGR